MKNYRFLVLLVNLFIAARLNADSYSVSFNVGWRLLANHLDTTNSLGSNTVASITYGNSSWPFYEAQLFMPRNSAGEPSAMVFTYDQTFPYEEFPVVSPFKWNGEPWSVDLCDPTGAQFYRLRQ